MKHQEERKQENKKVVSTKKQGVTPIKKEQEKTSKSVNISKKTSDCSTLEHSKEKKSQNELPTLVAKGESKTNSPVVSYQHTCYKSQRKKTGLKQRLKDWLVPEEVDDRYLPTPKPNSTVTKPGEKMVKKWDPVSGGFYYDREIPASDVTSKEIGIKNFSEESPFSRFSVKEVVQKASIMTVCIEAGYERKYLSAFLKNAENFCKAKGITLIQFVFFGDTIHVTDKLLLTKLKDAKIEEIYEKVTSKKEVLLFDAIDSVFSMVQQQNKEQKPKSQIQEEPEKEKQNAKTIANDEFNLEDLLKKAEKENKLDKIGKQEDTLFIDGKKYQLHQFYYLFILSGKECGSKATKQEVKQLFKTLRRKNPNIDAILTDICSLQEMCALGFRNMITLKLK